MKGGKLPSSTFLRGGQGKNRGLLNAIGAQLLQVAIDRLSSLQAGMAQHRGPCRQERD